MDNNSNVPDNVMKFKGIYLNSLIQFIKWTTTFALFAVVWTASSFRIFGIPSNIFQILSFIFLILSVIIAVIILYSIVFTSGSDWAHSSDLFISSVNKDLHKEVKTILSNDDYHKVFPTATRYHKTCINPLIPQTPFQFNIAILLHLITILIGILLYILALFY
jgi:hypothetical protein